MNKTFRTYSDALGWKLSQTGDQIDSVLAEISTLEKQTTSLRTKVRRLRVQKEVLTRLIRQELNEEALHETAALETGIAPLWEQLPDEVTIGPAPEPSVGEVILAYMSSPPNQVWRVRDLEDRLQADGWGFNRSAIRTAISRMKDKGEIDQVGRGQYQQTDQEERRRS